MKARSPLPAIATYLADRRQPAPVLDPAIYRRVDPKSPATTEAICDLAAAWRLAPGKVRRAR